MGAELEELADAAGRLATGPGAGEGARVGAGSRTGTDAVPEARR